MKIKVLFLFIAIGFSFLSCNTDDEQNLEKETITGTWNLKNVNGGLAGINIDYSLGEVIWTFNVTNNTVSIENNIDSTGPEDIYAGLDTGTYSYTIEDNEGIQILHINDHNIERAISFDEGNLILIDSNITDGYLNTFKR